MEALQPYNLRWDDDVLFTVYLRTLPEPTMPSDSKINHRALILRDRMLELEALDDKIRAEDNRVSEVINSALQATMYRRKVMLWMSFPILKLPEEIIRDIFHYVVWSQHGADLSILHRLRLTWVCKRFREIALEDPTLWSSIFFCDKFPWTRSIRFVELSKNAKIDISFFESPVDEQGRSIKTFLTPEQVDVMLDAILPKISQIRILAVAFQTDEAVQRFTSRFAVAGPPDSLERYDVHRSGLPYLWQNHTGVLIPITVFDPPPRLNTLILDGLRFKWGNFVPANLRRLDLLRLNIHSCPTSAHFSQILEASQFTLFRLALDAGVPYGASMHQVRRIDLPNLRELAIGDLNPVYAAYVLLHIRAPRVMNLTLMRLRQHDYSTFLQGLTNLFPEVQLMTLQTLETGTTEEHLATIVRWLDSMPQVKMVRLAGLSRFVLSAFLESPAKYWSAEKLEAYRKHRKDNYGEDEPSEWPVILPELRYLFFEQLEHGATADLCRERKRLGVPFKSVYYRESNRAYVTPQELEKIKAEVRRLTVLRYVNTSPEEQDIKEGIEGSVIPGKGLVYRIVGNDD